MKPYVPIIVDVEASGFGSLSYPVEIGIALPNGERYCSLIAPDPTWLHWDPEAEALHGLSRDKLITNGKSPKEVCQSLNALLKGETLYSDGWTVDYPWIRTLFQAGREDITFRVSALEMVLKEEDFLSWDKTKAMVREKIGAGRHRASWDARVIQETFLELQSQKKKVGFAPTENTFVD
ncbi:hypothetical protein [Colwellia sp. 4_MG-2023]|jgi:hypothetical protein|uniref:3'-5' exonuclease n=1 Tax=Colwellia sp. 4_MG-2023 TaxID=3062668 RepID=UPI001C08427B|nr:hypothetical protein [Colwellia sp. 4_MG-2023]MBU2924674.1 hypothetical protein [Colwellia sp. C2M11]MDO6507807.1 hypothetical protein [Colwellia sp. 5_MG-2023]